MRSTELSDTSNYKVNTLQTQGKGYLECYLYISKILLLKFLGPDQEAKWGKWSDSSVSKWKALSYH